MACSIIEKVKIFEESAKCDAAYQPDGVFPVSSTNKAINGQLVLPTGDGTAEFSTPRALETEEIPRYVELFRKSARKAIEAGKN